jgi:class 3 adenylate cyclase
MLNFSCRDITVSGIQYPESSYRFNRLYPNSPEVNIIIVTLRTARCARFVDACAAVGAGQRFNLYWALNRLRSDAKDEAQQRSLSHVGNSAEKVTLIDESTVDYSNRQQKNSPVASVSATVHDDAGNKARKERQIGESDDEQEIGPNQSTLSVQSGISVRDSSILAEFAERGASRDNSEGSAVPKSRFQSGDGNEHNKSQVGSDMRRLTERRVAIGILLILVCTVLFTYVESTTTQIRTMVVLHTQTKTSSYIDRSLHAAISSSIPTLYEYRPAIDSNTYYPNPDVNGTNLTPRNIINITITDPRGTSVGLFDNSRSVKRESMVEIFATIFVILSWFAGVVSFTNPVVMLVITPVEQMVRLLRMLTLDPLGYQSTPEFQKFLRDEDAISENTGWSRDVLKGMETAFLKSTILRIGSLLKVGFGSAGVQIIQSNLESGQNQNMLTLNSQGTTVSCIFLFCDIRQFTDATEQLQEEVFVFTNRIAEVVHSICNSYGGAANKNVGDAFLLTWSLDEKGRSGENRPLKARNSQADKALLSVIKICIALAHDDFFLGPLSKAAVGRLRTKMKDRAGPIVQIGFGLHAGKAVQGAIGSQRKIDATYVAESVELAEFLESSTKKYKVNMAMSGEFHKLLHSRTRDRCRHIDRTPLHDQGDESYEEMDGFLDIFTFDMDVDALQRSYATPKTMKNGETDDLRSATFVYRKKRRESIRNRRKSYAPKRIMVTGDVVDSDPSEDNENTPAPLPPPSLASILDTTNEHEIGIYIKPPELVLPSGPAPYSQSVWSSPEMKKMRQKYTQDPIFFENYRLGLEAFYGKKWDDAEICFRGILETLDDGPSKYFLKQIEDNKGTPPEGFSSYRISD